MIALMLCISFTVFGRQPNTTAQNQPKKPTIEQLQQDNEKLQQENEKIQQDLGDVEMDVENQVDKFRGEVRQNLAIWFSVLTVIMALLGAALGIVMPHFLNSKNEQKMQKKLDEATDLANTANTQAESANKQAEKTASQAAEIAKQVNNALSELKKATEAVAIIEQLKKDIEIIKEEIDESKKSANRAAKEAKVSELLSLAQSESNPLIAIEHYTAAIQLSPNDPLLYEKRSKLRSQTGDNIGADEDSNKAKYLMQKENDYNESLAYVNMGDYLFATGKYRDASMNYTKALKLRINEKEILLKRAECYKRMSEQEPDPEKKQNLIDKANADADKASRL